MFCVRPDLLLDVRQSTLHTKHFGIARKSSLLLDLTAHLAIRIAFDGGFGVHLHKAQRHNYSQTSATGKDFG
ncbi:MAG: hypothetical protein A2289_11930 [Deltaproteobacteria bacterium RIFOXYA12_FULL_58_15]|nr:MAG: hypothetical protein A2289_11930 [Deltaproteobacteria bacterium RIFOXYA12_FULL_58_15]